MAVTAPPQARPILCPVCRRRLGQTTATAGALTLKCPECRRWRVVVIGVLK
jgi:uncharacterized protein YbaR (Trm112 family)